MAIFKCKMCGGALEINNNETVIGCEYCGTQQTLPRLDDDRKANLYDRANHFRRNNEFDKAMGIYEQILNDDNTDAESYWSLVLCRYGIEYVEDPASHKRVPTVNRAQFTSVFDDEDYKSALKYADGFQKEVYEAEAKVINEIQKGILAISQQEEPFDVFICYKETDSNGRRTQDSVIATELYHELTREGYKVFFSRITLEDKLGTAYEPYIFAALNSSKVMVVLGTKAEYFNAVWVKNEWSRYLALIKNGARKILIPAYRDMDPYDLPEEFSHLQAQDMTKLGFMQDLIRGINKLVRTEAPQTTVVKETVVAGVNASVEPLLKRVNIFLGDGDWKSADEYCEKVLDIDPENARAYLGKLMAVLRVSKKENLKNCPTPFDKNSNYQKALRFGDAEIKSELAGYIDFINERNENERRTAIYNDAKNAMNSAKTASEYKKAAHKFDSIRDFKDSAVLAEECLKKADEVAKLAEYNSKLKKYNKACFEMDTRAYSEIRNKISSIQRAKNTFETIVDFKDSKEKISECDKILENLDAEEKRIEEERLAEEKRIADEKRIAEECLAEEKRIADEKAKKRRKIRVSVFFVVFCVVLAFLGVLDTVIIPTSKYNKAIELMNEENYIDAYSAFIALNGFKDSNEKAEAVYSEYKLGMFRQANVGDYVKLGTYEQDSVIENGKEEIEWLVLEKQADRVLVISKYALDCIKYNEENTDITWEKCSLRKWLNDDFYNSSFENFEKETIAVTEVPVDENPGYDTAYGNATQDRIFILSVTEAKNYFSTNDERECDFTAYATARISGYIQFGWWLRTPGSKQAAVSFVAGDGGIIGIDGNYIKLDNKTNLVSIAVDTDVVAVRPAMWINIE